MVLITAHPQCNWETRPLKHLVVKDIVGSFGALVSTWHANRNTMSQSETDESWDSWTTAKTYNAELRILFMSFGERALQWPVIENTWS